MDQARIYGRIQYRIRGKVLRGQPPPTMKFVQI